VPTVGLLALAHAAISVQAIASDRNNVAAYRAGYAGFGPFVLMRNLGSSAVWGVSFI
jgi:hypothetical protein